MATPASSWASPAGLITRNLWGLGNERKAPAPAVGFWLKLRSGTSRERRPEGGFLQGRLSAGPRVLVLCVVLTRRRHSDGFAIVRRSTGRARSPKSGGICRCKRFRYSPRDQFAVLTAARPRHDLEALVLAGVDHFVPQSGGRGSAENLVPAVVSQSTQSQLSHYGKSNGLLASVARGWASRFCGVGGSRRHLSAEPIDRQCQPAAGVALCSRQFIRVAMAAAVGRGREAIV